MTIHRRYDRTAADVTEGFRMPGRPAFGQPPPVRPARSTRLRRLVRGRRGLAIAGGAVVVLLAGAAVQTMTSASAAEQGSVPANAIRAASFSDQSGARTESTVDAGGGQNVGLLASGDWMRYNGVDLGPAGLTTVAG